MINLVYLNEQWPRLIQRRKRHRARVRRMTQAGWCKWGRSKYPLLVDSSSQDHHHRSRLVISKNNSHRNTVLETESVAKKYFIPFEALRRGQIRNDLQLTECSKPMGMKNKEIVLSGRWFSRQMATATLRPRWPF